MIDARHAEVAAARRNRELRVAERLKLDAAKANVARTRAAIQQAETALAEARLRLERTEVKSPVAGVVMTRVASPGDKVMLRSDMPHSAHIVHLYDPKKLQVRVDVPLADAAKVGLGQPATVIVDVLPDREFRGELTRLVHKASIEKNTVEVKVAITDPDPQLKPDMLARVKFHAVTQPAGDSTMTTRQQLRVFAPEDLLLAGGGGRIAWVVETDGDSRIARRRVVTLGTHREDGWVEIADGLRPGDVLIAEAAGLDEGERVRVREELKR
jgi:RND family efflux transporter MFP subunit